MSSRKSSLEQAGQKIVIRLRAICMLFGYAIRGGPRLLQICKHPHVHSPPPPIPANLMPPALPTLSQRLGSRLERKREREGERPKLCISQAVPRKHGGGKRVNLLPKGSTEIKLGPSVSTQPSHFTHLCIHSEKWTCKKKRLLAIICHHMSMLINWRRLKT